MMGVYAMNKDSKYESIFSSRDSDVELPKYKMPEKESAPRVIKELIRDELFLDGNARQNLATFCQTYLSDEVHVRPQWARRKHACSAVWLCIAAGELRERPQAKT